MPRLSYGPPELSFCGGRSVVPFSYTNTAGPLADSDQCAPLALPAERGWCSVCGASSLCLAGCSSAALGQLAEARQGHGVGLCEVCVYSYVLKLAALDIYCTKAATQTLKLLQGRVGDCSLLPALAAQVCRRKLCFAR